MATLADALERASYAPSGTIAAGDHDALADAAAASSAALLRNAPVARRILAVIAPRSLVMRPGSAFAGAGTHARA